MTHACGLRCSTPYGDRSCGNGPVVSCGLSRATCAQRLTATDLVARRAPRRRPSNEMSAQRLTATDLVATPGRGGMGSLRRVLNALRRQILWQPGSAQTRVRHPGCSTPYGDRSCGKRALQDAAHAQAECSTPYGDRSCGKFDRADATAARAACSTPYGDRSCGNTDSLRLFVLFVLCSTPYGDRSCGKSHRTGFADHRHQVLNALRRQILWQDATERHRQRPLLVLNALRRQILWQSVALGNSHWVQMSAQRLTATDLVAIEDGFPLPVQVMSAQRLTATDLVAT